MSMNRRIKKENIRARRGGERALGKGVEGCFMRGERKALATWGRQVGKRLLVSARFTREGGRREESLVVRLGAGEFHRH
jgi:hypothetical protein